MAIPVLPIAGFALKYGSVALLGYAIARATSWGRLDQRAEDVMDITPEGLTLRTEHEQLNATWRWRRAFLMNSGKGAAIDATLLGRVRVRRLT